MGVGRAREFYQNQLKKDRRPLLQPTPKTPASGSEPTPIDTPPEAKVVVPPPASDVLARLQTLPDKDLRAIAEKKLAKVDGRWRRNTLIEKLIAVGGGNVDAPETPTVIIEGDA